MNAIVNSTFGWLLRREYWESKRGFVWAQVWTAVVVLVIGILGIVTLEVFRSRFANSISVDGSGVNISASGANLGDLLNNALSHNVPLVVRGLDASMLAFGLIGGVVLSFVVFFYFLGALYDDRRDRSILFWKSLPVSDTATVLSKVVAGGLLAPLAMVAVVLAGYLADQVIHTLWFMAHGLNPFTLIWAHVEPFSVWLHMLAMVPLYFFWALPTFGWLLFWSAAARSKPFLWAVLIPVAAGVLNWWISLVGLPHIGVGFFFKMVARGLLSAVPGSWVSVIPPDRVADVPEAVRHFGSYGQMAGVFATPQMWIGIAVGAVLIAAAIWLRRWRDEA